MSRFLSRILLILLIFSGFESLAQSKDALKKERDEITKEINYTNKLLGETRENRNRVEGELNLLNTKIRLREDLISSLKKEVRLYSRQIESNEENIVKLESELEATKERYADLIRLSYRTKAHQDRLMFIFASDDFFQAIKRIRYLRQMTLVRQDQAKKIEETKTELERLNFELDESISRKNELLDTETSARNVLAQDKTRRVEAISGLRSEEKTLISKLRKQEKQRENLNKEIQRIIEAEIRASKKDNEGVFSLTPEAAALSANFESNKGKLPWPVERGVITQKFGDNPHPVLAGIMVPNNGIDIATNKNATVRSLFDGTVSGVFSIPGAGRNVIVNHGGYRTVYSNLKEVFVSKGQKITAKESIGIVLTDEVNGKTEAHIEIWKVSQKGTTKEDPAKWIFRQ